MPNQQILQSNQYNLLNWLKLLMNKNQADSQIMFPRHLVVSHGKFVQKIHNKNNRHVPRTIEYIHTIRILNPNICNHQKIIEQLHIYYKEAIMERDAQIQDLKKIIKYMQEQISIKNSQLQKIKVKAKDFSLQLQPNNISRSRVDTNNQFQVSSIISDKYIPPKRKSFLEMFSSKIIEVDDLQVLKVKKQMKNTQQAMNNVTNILRKSRKKYKYVNPHLPQSLAQLEGRKYNESAQRKSTYEEGESQLTFSISQKSRESVVYNKNSLDQINQNTYQSSSKKSQQMKYVQELKQKMYLMNRQYEQQIQKYKRLLNFEKQKNCKNILHSMGLNISLDDESADIERIDSIEIKQFDDTQFMQESSSHIQKND